MSILCDWQQYHEDHEPLRIIGDIDGPDDGQMHFRTICEIDTDDVMTPEEQGQVVRLIVAAPKLLAACQLAIPANVCLTNTNIPDSMIVPLDVPMGDLRKIAAAIASATGAA